MASLTIRDIPDKVMERLRRAAQEEHRSMNGQAVQWLEQGARQWTNASERAALMQEIRVLRERMAKRRGPQTDSAKLVRRIRDQRGRIRS